MALDPGACTVGELSVDAAFFRSMPLAGHRRAADQRASAWGISKHDARLPAHRIPRCHRIGNTSDACSN